MGEAVEVANVLQQLGGYGIAGIFYYVWKIERTERLTLRDSHIETLRNLPKLTEAIERLMGKVEDLSDD